MTTFHIPNAINPKSWTCDEVIRDNVFDLEQLKEVVAILAYRADDQTQFEIVRYLTDMEPRK